MAWPRDNGIRATRPAGDIVRAAEQAGAMSKAKRPGREETDRGPIGRALSTSLLGNSPAFGFSIMITATFGAVTRLEGDARLLELVLFALAAALAVPVLEAVVTHGFTYRAKRAPPEVAMLGTALNIFSVGLGLGSAIAVGLAWDGLLVWPAAGFLAAAVYVLAESSEILLAERIQRRRGDPDATEGEDE